MEAELRVVPFRRWHYAWLAQANPTADGGSFTPVEHILTQLESQNSWTGVLDGNPIACAGTIQQWPGRHQAWAYLGKNSGPHMVWITKQVLAHVERVKGRVEFTVRSDFPIGQRWAKLLGFRIEAPCLVQYGPQGEDHVGFVRVN